MNLTNISDYEIKTYLVSPAADIIPASTMRAIIEQWEQTLNSDLTRLIAGSSAPPAITTYPATSRTIGYGLVINWEVWS